jgi:hypothetical protein
MPKFKKMGIGRGFLKIYQDDKNRLADKYTPIEAFQKMRVNIERLVDRGLKYAEEDEQDVLGFQRKPIEKY